MSSNKEIRYSIEVLKSYREEECPKTKEQITKMQHLFPSRKFSRRRKRSPNDKKISYQLEFLYTFKEKNTCQNVPKGVRYTRVLKRNSKLPKKTDKTDEKTASAFDSLEDDADESGQSSYPGKKFLADAGIDVEGKTFEELFELEKKLRTGASLDESNNSISSTPNRESQISESSVEDDIALILTDDFTSSPSRKDSNWLSLSTSSAGGTPTRNEDDLSISNELISSFDSLKTSGRSILASVLQEPEPEPEPEPPKPESIADEQTIAKGTQMGFKLLDLLKSEMESKGINPQNSQTSHQQNPGYPPMHGRPNTNMQHPHHHQHPLRVNNPNHEHNIHQHSSFNNVHPSNNPPSHPTKFLNSQQLFASTGNENYNNSMSPPSNDFFAQQNPQEFQNLIRRDDRDNENNVKHSHMQPNNYPSHHQNMQNIPTSRIFHNMDHQQQGGGVGAPSQAGRTIQINPSQFQQQQHQQQMRMQMNMPMQHNHMQHNPMQRNPMQMHQNQMYQNQMHQNQMQQQQQQQQQQQRMHNSSHPMMNYPPGFPQNMQNSASSNFRFPMHLSQPNIHFGGNNDNNGQHNNFQQRTFAEHQF